MKFIIFCHVDPSAGNDREISNYKSAVTRQRRVNDKRGMVFCAQSVPMGEQATMEYIIPPLSNNCIATEEW
jgi:hypothetical protein